MSQAAIEYTEPVGSLRNLEVTLAWAACRVDGQLHVDQWRALRAVVGQEDDPSLDTSQDIAELAEQLDALDPDLSRADRARLFLTASWVALSDGRTHGREVWLLCELRRALRLAPAFARRLYQLAHAHRRRRTGPPGAAERAALLTAGYRLAARAPDLAEA